MPGVLQDHHVHVGRYFLSFAAESVPTRFLPTDHQHRHRQLGMGKLCKVFSGLRERDEVGPAGTHASGARVCKSVCLTVGLWNGVVLVGSKVVPVMLEIGALASLHQKFRSGPVEAEMPYTGIVVRRFPLADAG